MSARTAVLALRLTHRLDRLVRTEPGDLEHVGGAGTGCLEDAWPARLMRWI